MEPSEATRWPIDFDALEQGDVIAPEKIERIKEVSRESPKAYQLALLAIRDQVLKELWKRGKTWTVCIKGDALVILSDQEAADYNANRAEIVIRQLAATHRRNMGVNAAELDEDQLQRHNRSLETIGAFLAAGTKAAGMRLNLEPTRRTTPGLPEPEESNDETE